MTTSTIGRNDTPESSLKSNWWTLVLRGLIAVLFGVLAVATPHITTRMLLLLFAGYALAEGITTVIGAVRSTNRERRSWTLLIEGGVGVLTGVIALLAPDVAGRSLVYLVAAWAAATGALRIISATRLRGQVSNAWLLALGGLVSLGFAALLVLSPRIGALALVWQIGAYAIVLGITYLVFGVRLRSWGHTLPSMPTRPT